MKTKTTPLIRICARIIEKCKRAGIKRYGSKFDNKLYTNYQFIALFCLKQKEQCGYKALQRLKSRVNFLYPFIFFSFQ